MIKKKNSEHCCNQMLIEGKPENKQLKTHLFNTCKEFLAHQILDLKKKQERGFNTVENISHGVK